jgi:hypothetical protein
MITRGLRFIAACLIGAALGACSEKTAPTVPAQSGTQKTTTNAVGVRPPAAVSSAPNSPTAPSSTAAAVPALQPRPEPPPASPSAPPSVTAPGDAAQKWMITVERAKQLYDAKEVDGHQVVFIDARTFLEFRDNGHIRGAMHYSKDYTRGPPQPKVRNYLPGSVVVIYCHGELCTDSIDVGRYFESLKLDIGPIFVIKDGIPAFMRAYPDLIDKGNEVGFD